MQQINTLPPERMTAEQRCAELAGILAAGLCRLRQPDFAKSANMPQETQFVLGFPVEQSVHSDIDNNPSMEP
jgi:hypothetical protein